MPESGTVFVVDDDASVRKALGRLLEAAGFEVEKFETAEQFLARKEFSGLGCVIVDLRLPGLDGLGLQRKLRDARAELPVVFLSGHANVPTSVEGMKGGAIDFLTKPVDEQALLAAVTEALDHHHRVLEQSRLVRSFAEHLAQLTPREFEVLREVITGRLNKQIAARLGIAEKTVKVHRGRVMMKLEVSSVAELVRLCSAGGVKPASRAGNGAREQPLVD